jgi:hypothetical protein
MNNELTIQDLAVMRSIIDAATRGGVFKAQDLSAVGVVHDKLNNIIEAFVEKNKEESTEGEASAEEATAE